MNFIQQDDDVYESPPLHSTHKDECADGIVNDDPNMMLTSSDIGNADDSFDEPVSNHCFDDWQMVSGDTVVECLPDYILYRDKYSTDSVVTFSSSCIKIEGNWQAETFEYQWGVDRIMNIECQWCDRLELATIKIRVNSKGTTPTKEIQGHTGFEEFKFAIVEDWYRKQDEIMSLEVYQPLWNIVLSSDMERDAKVLPGQSKIFPLKHYFPPFEDSFEDVIYPKGDPDAVSISKRDVDRLEPDTFVNDTIIDFYIKYLKNKIDPSERHRFHFFNSFFYPKLAELGKSPSGSLEGRAAFRSVRRWTRKISLFDKDYIFVPVNFNYHWSLIVICHPGEVADFRDSDARKSMKLPCILHMDSIRGSHSGLKGLIQGYLWEEWKERQAGSSEDISLKFLNMRFFSLELPQQQNLYDCGLFLLHYVELFLEGNLVNFNPLKISSFSNFLTANWFQPAEASLKRAYIQRIIYDILDDVSCESSPSTGGDENCTSNPKSVDSNRTTSEFLTDRSGFSKVFHKSVPCSQAGQGLELSLFQASFAESIQPVNDSGFVLRGPDEAGAAIESFCQAFEKTARSEAQAAVESFCRAFEKTGPSEAGAAVESFCQAFEKTGPSEAGAAVESFCRAFEKTKAKAAVEFFCQAFKKTGPYEAGAAVESFCRAFEKTKAKAAVESFCQAFEKTASSEEFENASKSIQLVNDSGFVSKGPAESEAAIDSFCQVFEQTTPSEEFKNASESIQPINDSGFVSRGPAEAEAAVESFCQAFEKTGPSEAGTAVESFCQAFEKTMAEAAVESFCQAFEKTKAEAAVESFCQAFEKTKAEAAVESFCQAFEKTKAEAAVESFCRAFEKTAPSEAETPVESFCQAFEKPAPSEEFENASKSIQLVNDSGFVSKGPAEAEAAVESFCQAFEQTTLPEEFKNASKSIQPVNDSAFVSRGPAEAEAAVESFCRDFEQTAPSEEEAAVESFCQAFEKTKADAAVESFCQAFEKTSPSEAEAPVESFCRAFEKPAPSEDFENASKSIQPVNDSGFVSRGPAEAEASVECFCQAFEQTAPSKGFKNASESIQPVNDSGFVSRGPAKAEAAVESFCQDFEQKVHSECSNAMPPVEMGFVSRGPAETEAAVESLCQAFEKTVPSEEFKNASESIQPVNDSGFVSRGPAEAEAAVESLCQDFKQTAPSECSNAMPPVEQEHKSYKHFRCSLLGIAGFEEPTTVTSEASGAFLSKESGAEPLRNRGSNMCENVHMDIDSFKESICASNDLLKSEDANHSKIGTNLSMEVKRDHHKPKFSSLGNLKLFVDLRVPSSSGHMSNGNNNVYSKNCGSRPRNCDALEDMSAACEPVQSICDGSGTRVQQATKKRRLTPIKEGPSSDEDFHE